MDNVGFKKRTLCAANPRSRKATISSFFKSLALLRFSFSVCCRTCLRLLFREGLVVLRVASVTLYDAGDADILSSRGGMFETLAGGARMALFCLRKVSTKNSSFTRARVLVALFLPFFFSFLDVCVLSWPADIVFFGLFGPRRKSATHRPKDVSNILSKVSPHNLASHHHRYQTHEKSFHAFQRERESLGALNSNNNNNDSFFIVSAFFF